MAEPYLISTDLVPCDLPLESIFLDPNNPRFVGPDWHYIAQSDITSATVQEDAKRTLMAHFDVEKLIMSMESNGYLPLDRVIVKAINDSQYFVLEGNRRICAAKELSSRVAASDVRPELVDSLRHIPCLQYVGTESDAAWIFQGIRHISGIAEWSSYNKATLLVERMEKEGLNYTQVGKKFGLTAYGAGQWARGYYAFKQAREESDFISEVDNRSYPYFQELFNRSSIALRDWLGWTESDRRFENDLEFNEFVGWLYPRNPDEEASTGDWDRRWIRTRDELRTVAALIRKYPNAFKQFRSEGDLAKAYSKALANEYEESARRQSDPAQEVFATIEACSKALENIPWKMLTDDSVKARLFEKLDVLHTEVERIRSQSQA